MLITKKGYSTLSTWFLVLALGFAGYAIYQININKQIRALESAVSQSYNSNNSKQVNTELGNEALRLNNKRIKDPKPFILLCFICFCFQWYFLAKSKRT